MWDEQTPERRKPAQVRRQSWLIGAVVTVVVVLIAGSALPSDEFGEAYAPVLFPVVICLGLIVWTVLWAIGLAVWSVRQESSARSRGRLLCPECGRRGFDGRSCALCGHKERQA